MAKNTSVHKEEMNSIMTTSTSVKKEEIKNIRQIIGNCITQLRTKYNITKTDLAKLLNVTPQQIYKYENGLDRFSFENLIIFANYINVPIEDIIKDVKKYTKSNQPVDEQTLKCSRMKIEINKHINKITDIDTLRTLKEMIKHYATAYQKLDNS